MARPRSANLAPVGAFSQVRSPPWARATARTIGRPNPSRPGPATGKTHVNHLLAKTGTRDRAALVAYAFRTGRARG